jgi:hypothetical protein
MVLITNVTPSIKDMSFVQANFTSALDLSQPSCNENGSYGSFMFEF